MTIDSENKVDWANKQPLVSKEILEKYKQSAANDFKANKIRESKELAFDFSGYLQCFC